MSLINDALKRAKLEALEREAQTKADYGLPTPRAPKSRIPGRLLWTVSLLALALVGVAIGWFLARAGRSADATPAHEVPSTAIQPFEASPAAAEVTGAANGQKESGADADDSGRAAAEERIVEASAPARTTAAGVAGATAESRAELENSGEISQPQSAAPASASLADGATHLRVLDAGHERLELQGIAYRDGGSVAIINDLMVSQDDMVGGFLVVAIEPERVQLQGRGVTLYLSLH